jgi:hypothetical protein
MQAALDQADSEQSALLTESPGWHDSATTVRDETRHVTTVLGSEERAFLMEFWERGVMMATGRTTELTAAAGTTDAWQSGSRLAELRESWTFVHYVELAEAFESGNPTQVKWDILRRSDARHLNRELLEAAYADAPGQPRA